MAAKKKAGGERIKVSKQAVDDAFKDLSNWGRWGKDDQIGTLNHITPAEVVAARARIPSLQHGRRFEIVEPMAEPTHLRAVRNPA